MSSTVVPIAIVDQVLPHPDPETTSLELIQVLGWQLVARKGQYTQGQKLVYVPPGNVLPLALSEKWGVTKYLSKQRVRSIKLRGEPSFGLAFTPDEEWPVGENVASFYGIEKYAPPVRMMGDDAEPEHPLFIRYTEIENLRNFPDILEPDDPVIVSEKIHGTNCRVGLIEGQVMCGSFRVQRKKPEGTGNTYSLYWYPLQIEGVENLLNDLGKTSRQVLLFGEVYGPGVQSLTYGVQQGKVEFRIFDLYCDGKYLNWQDAAELCAWHKVPTVPILAWEVPFHLDAIKQLSAGNTTIGNVSHIREGVVVRPVRERNHPKTGRVILKYINDDYLLKQSEQKITDYTEV